MTISKKDYIKYINSIVPTCFHCEGDIGKENQRVYEIKCTRVKDYMPNGPNQILFFHEKCFKEVAGSAFEMEEIYYGDKKEKSSS